MNIILTGVPGIGKTTLIEGVADALGERAGGVVTREIREGGSRTGFAIESLDGERRILASRHFEHGPRVGPYRVSLDSLEAVGVGALRRALDRRQVVVMECPMGEPVVPALTRHRANPSSDIHRGTFLEHSTMSKPVVICVGG
jgi:nucleoside-triphosphatase